MRCQEKKLIDVVNLKVNKPDRCYDNDPKVMESNIFEGKKDTLVEIKGRRRTVPLLEAKDRERTCQHNT